MLRGVFQGGDSVELLSSRGKDALKPWKHSDRVVREYDAALKSFLVNISGGPQAFLEAPGTARHARKSHDSLSL